MDSKDVRTAAAFGPASLSNLGPGFDTLGICIEGWGDTVTATRKEGHGITVDSNILLPQEPAKNTASWAAHQVLSAVDAGCGVHLYVEKGIPLGSGIGGSAASAAAAAWATNLMLGQPLDKPDLVNAVLEGEAIASDGVRHGDNVLPALFGGMVLTSPSNPADYRLIPLSRSLHLALLLPDLRVFTADARAILPSHVSLRAATENAGDLAFQIHDFITGNYERVGCYMMRDRLVEPVRSAKLPFYAEARARAVAAGAWGCALTGSGPAMFALAPDECTARAVAVAMVAAAVAAGIAASGFVTASDMEGVRTV